MDSFAHMSSVWPAVPTSTGSSGWPRGIESLGLVAEEAFAADEEDVLLVGVAGAWLLVGGALLLVAGALLLVAGALLGGERPGGTLSGPRRLESPRAG